MKRTISAALAILMLFSFSVSALAATTWPSVSKTKYIEMTSPSNFPVYKDSQLKTRGTHSPAKSYQASIAKGDTLYIYDITGSYTYLSYPTSSGRRCGYTSTKSLFGVNAPVQKVTSSAKVTTYKLPSGVKSGSIAAGDVCYRLGTASGYHLIAYQAKSGNRGWKAAFVPKESWEMMRTSSSGTSYNSSPSSSTSSAEIAILQRLNNMMEGSYGNGAYKLNTRYKGNYAQEECKGFMKAVGIQLFGFNIGSTKDKPYNYQINYPSSKASLVGSLTKLSDKSNSSVKSLMNSARAGDWIQVQRSHGGSHSMVFLYSDNNSVTVLECNVDGKNTIQKNTYSWSQFRSDNAAVSVYTAKNYMLK